MLHFNKINDTRQQLHAWRMAGERIVFVPTMGNLHQGHLRLVEHACQLGQRVIVSIFVNPKQFNDKDDFAAYPNTLEEDFSKLQAAGVDALFLPAVEVIYPDGHQKNSEIIVPGLSDILCGAYRTGHFIGVATVVAKLFNIVQAEVAVFGEKDFQQLMVIRRMVNELCFPIEIIGVPTERECDGLAMSSRNGYLNTQERQRAPLLYKALKQAKSQLQSGGEDIPGVEVQAQQRLQEGGFRVEYFSVRSAKELSLAGPGTQDLVIVAAAWLGKTRLIDNIRLNFG